MNRIRKITIIDPITDEKSVYQIRLLYEGKDMENNNLCFCGSGMKKKKCHPDIHEKSLFATLLHYYKELDDESKTVQNPLCKKGCNECCESTFSVSQSELFMILNSLKITDEIAIYKAKADEIVNNKYEMPDKCIFVDDYTGACRIYEVRPLVCRLYGVVKTDDNVCEQIKNNQHIYDTLLTSSSINIAHNTFSFDNGIMTTPKPLIYWISKLTSDGDLNSDKQKRLFEAAKSYPISEYLRILQI